MRVPSSPALFLLTFRSRQASEWASATAASSRPLCPAAPAAGAPPRFAAPPWPGLKPTAGACGASCAGWRAQGVLLSHSFIPFCLSRYAKGTPSDSGVVRNRLQFALPNVRRKPCKENRRGIPANRRRSGGQNAREHKAIVHVYRKPKNSQLISASAVAV